MINYNKQQRMLINIYNIYNKIHCIKTALKITAGQQSLTIVTMFVTTKKHHDHQYLDVITTF